VKIKIEIKTYKEKSKRKNSEKYLRGFTVRVAQNDPHRPGPNAATARAGLLAAHQASTWAWAGKATPHLGRNQPARA
jgi:hypothetical protein